MLGKKGVELLKTFVVARYKSGYVCKAVAQLEPKHRLEPLFLGSAHKSQTRSGMIDVGEQELLVTMLQGPSNEFFGLEYTIAQTKTRVYTHVIEYKVLQMN